MRYLVIIALIMAACGHNAKRCEREDQGRQKVHIWLNEHVELFQVSLPVGIHCNINCKEAMSFWGSKFVIPTSSHRFLIEKCATIPGVYGRTEIEYLYSGEILSAHTCISETIIGHWAEQTVIAHEIGHILGLSHDPDWCPSVMATDRLRPLSDVTITQKDYRTLHDTL